MSETIEKPAANARRRRHPPDPPDGADKVTGRAAYGADFDMPGQLVGKILRSPHAHARIVSIDTSKAKALPGVKAVVTGADFPDLGRRADRGGEAASHMRDLA
jgi:CO/xanthine dehydrogenase Mo-binding subunit